MSKQNPTISEIKAHRAAVARKRRPKTTKQRKQIMTEDQLKAVQQADEILNEACMPTYSKLAALIRDDIENSQDRLDKFREAVKRGLTTLPR